MNDILDYYHAGKEADRLQDPWGRLEFERTCRLLLESLPPDQIPAPVFASPELGILNARNVLETL